MKDKNVHPCSGLPEDQIEMLNEPLLTDEGFLNPVCMAEIEAKIKNMPETYERLANDPEWSTPFFTSESCIVPNLARWAVAQAGCIVPPDIDVVIIFVRTCLRTSYLKNVTGGLSDPFYGADLSLCEVNRILWEILKGFPQFEAWNEKDVMDPLGCDWIDLSALLHNVCISIRDYRRHWFAFDRKFEREHGEIHAT